MAPEHPLATAMAPPRSGLAGGPGREPEPPRTQGGTYSATTSRVSASVSPSWAKQPSSQHLRTEHRTQRTWVTEASPSPQTTPEAPHPWSQEQSWGHHGACHRSGGRPKHSCPLRQGWHSPTLPPHHDPRMTFRSTAKGLPHNSEGRENWAGAPRRQGSPSAEPRTWPHSPRLLGMCLRRRFPKPRGLTQVSPIRATSGPTPVIHLSGNKKTHSLHMPSSGALCPPSPSQVGTCPQPHLPA